MAFSWLFRGPLLSRKTVFGPFSLLFRGFFVAPVLGKFYAYSPWNSLFVLVFLGYRTSIARYVAKWGIALICLCKTRHQEGVSHPVGGLLGWLRKYRAIGGIALSRDMGPLRLQRTPLQALVPIPHENWGVPFFSGPKARRLL